MIIKEINDNLFRANTNEFVLAHCISRDCKMSMGIAKEFNNKFPYMKQYLVYETHTTANKTAVAYNNGTVVVINLITKEKYYQKPTLHTIRKAIIELKDICNKYKFDKLAIPKIGSGLDKLNWNDVKNILIEELSETLSELNIYYL